MIVSDANELTQVAARGILRIRCCAATMRVRRPAGRWLALWALAGLSALSAAPSVVFGALPQPIYFFTDTANVINSQNPLVIRPSSFLMFQDGSWFIQDLHWSGWGTRAAHASGISNASNDIPNVAQGKRIKTPAEVTLSNPGRFEGHEVYRCFTLTLPSHPSSAQHLCLQRSGSEYLLLPPARKVAPGAAQTTLSFYGPRPNSSGIFCAMGADAVAGASAGVYCYSLNPQRTVQMGVAGALKVCIGGTSSTDLCDIGNPGEGTPTLAAGEQKSVGGFRCRAEQAAVKCTVIKTGKGFLIASDGVTPLGGATTARA